MAPLLSNTLGLSIALALCSSTSADAFCPPSSSRVNQPFTTNSNSNSIGRGDVATCELELARSHYLKHNPFSRSAPCAATTTTTSTRLHSFTIKSIFRSTEAVDTTTSSTSRTTTLSPTTTTTTTHPHQHHQQGSETSVSSFKNSLTTSSLQATSTVSRKLKTVSRSIRSLQWPEGVEQAKQFVLQYWWALPSFLALVPLFTTFVLGTGDAIMPRWWPCTKMDHIVQAPDAFMVISCFLVSNIAYFAAGAFLVHTFPFQKQANSSSSNSSSNSSTANSSVTATNILALKTKLQSIPIVPTRQTWLGLLMFASGIISTVFHTEQALGSYALANSLCYIDHAIAGTATFYWFHTCGLPSKRVWVLGMAGMACLTIPHPAYAWLHSMWHFLSAGAATLWALESFGSGVVDEEKAPRLVKKIALPGAFLTQENDIKDS